MKIQITRIPVDPDKDPHCDILSDVVVNSEDCKINTMTTGSYYFTWEFSKGEYFGLLTWIYDIHVRKYFLDPRRSFLYSQEKDGGPDCLVYELELLFNEFAPVAANTQDLYTPDDLMACKTLNLYFRSY